MQYSNNIICKLCFHSTSQLFQVQGYQFPTCFKCSEVITKDAVPQFHQENMNNRNILSSSSMNLARSRTDYQQKQQVHDKLNSTQKLSTVELELALKNMDGELLIGDEGMCPLCKKIFNRRTALLNHIRNHSVDKKYTCNYCQKGFSQQANLRNHERIHRNDRPYVCECGKAFTQITNLNNHKRLHTGERPFVCIETNCGRSFAQVTNLNNHMKTHHKVQQYNCSQCSRKFHTVTRLNNHLATHGDSSFVVNNKYRIKIEEDNQFAPPELLIPISVSSINLPAYQQQLQSMSGELFTNNATKKVLSMSEIINNVQIAEMDRINNFNMFLNSIASSNSLLTQAAAINSSKHICNHCYCIFKSNQSLVRHVEKLH